MHLKGTEGNEFELRVVGYQFAGTTGIAEDDNWLSVEITVRTLERQWRTRDPCLMVCEAHALSEWISKLSKGEAADQELEFTEPILRFGWSSAGRDAMTIRVWLLGELLPPGSPRVFSGADCYVDLTVDRGDLFDASRTLQAQLRNFPPRFDRR